MAVNLAPPDPLSNHINMPCGPIVRELFRQNYVFKTVQCILVFFCDFAAPFHKYIKLGKLRPTKRGLHIGYPIIETEFRHYILAGCVFVHTVVPKI